MTCAACSSRVQRTLERAEGVSAANVNLMTGGATVEYDPGVTSPERLVETILDRPDWGLIAFHAVVPQFAGTESVLLATGILGATVMPHVIFLHSGLMQGRIRTNDPVKLKKLREAIPAGRMAKPREIAEVVAFLADDAPSYITATTFFVDGGIMHASPGL